MQNIIDFFVEQYNEAFGGNINNSVNDALNPKLINFFGVQVDPSVFTAIIISVIIILTVLIIRFFIIPRFQKHPKGVQLLLETMVTFFDDTSKEATHKKVGFVSPYVYTAAIYIALATLIELFGFRPVFASINGCIAMGLMTFIMINICGFKVKGLKRLMRYIKNPLNIVTDLSVPFSLSLRIFGSILSGFIITEVLYSMLFTSFVIPIITSIFTTLLHAFLQAYLFAVLTNIYVNEAIE